MISTQMFELRLTRTKNVLPSVDGHNNVWEQYIDLNSIMSGVRHSYRKSDLLIKYSKKEHSPVSSIPSNVLHLGTPYSYGDLSMIGLVRDDLEGISDEFLNWNEPGSNVMEMIKRAFTPIDPVLRINVKAKLSWQLSDHYVLFCTSIYPTRNNERQVQMKRTNPYYDFTTIIESPTSFAKQLGIDVRKQLDTVPIIVYHGPVIYLDEAKKSELINRCLKMHCILDSIPSFLSMTEDEIDLFVKGTKYQVQQEYRFVVYTPKFRHRNGNLKLNVSDNLRKLMFPML